MAYTRLRWVEAETPLSAQNMNNIEDGIEELQSRKVDKESGKGLSDQNYTAAEKSKLAGIEEGAEVNRTYTAVTGKPTEDTTPAFGGSVTVSQVSQDADGQLVATDRRIIFPSNNASTTLHGLMSTTDKAKLNGIQSGAQKNPGVATTSANGLMSAADKTKLNSIEIFSLTAGYSGSFTLSAFQHTTITFRCSSTQCAFAAIQAIQLPAGVAIGGIEKQISDGNLIGIIVKVSALDRGVTVSNPTATLLVIRNAVQ